MKKWTEDQEEYLRKISNGLSNKEITSKINQKFNTTFTASAIQTKKTKLKIISGYKYMPKYTQEVIDYILKNYQNRDNIELANLLNEKFNLNTNGDKVSMFKANFKRRFGIDLRTGINKGCFKKGQVPINKGTKGMFNVGGNSGSFKKGNIPANHREVGEERIGKGGYVEIKVKDGNKNKNWMPKQRYIYEQINGPIPAKHKVIFLDGDKNNFDISNLKLVSNAEEVIMNNKNLRYNKKELTETGHLIAQIIHKRGQLKNERL